MKNIIILLISFNCFLMCYSQKKPNEIYLFFNKKPAIEIKNDTLLFQKFILDFNLASNAKEIFLKIDKNGNLIKNIKIKSSRDRNINLTYINENDNNVPMLIHKNQIKNSLMYEEIVANINPENFYEIVSNYDVYIIECELNDKEYYMAKKVFLEKLAGL